MSRFNPSVKNLQEMQKLFEDFLFDQEIAEKMNASLATIKKYRKRYDETGKLSIEKISNTSDSRKEKIKIDDYVPVESKNSKKLIAFDQSSRLIGYSVWENNKLISYGVVDFSASKDTIHRLYMISKWMKSFIEEKSPEIVYFEDIQLESNVGTFKTLSMVLGVCKVVAHALSISYESIYSSEWRKFCGIKGTNRQQLKRNAQLYVLKEFGLKVTDDEAEAICIGKFGCSKLNEKKYLNWDD